MRSIVLLVSALLILQFVSMMGAAPPSAGNESAPAANAAEPSEALWRFDTHG
jgi:hypothetical protein